MVGKQVLIFLSQLRRQQKKWRGGWVRSRGEEEGERECGARVKLVLDSRATPRDVRAGCTEANVSGRNFPPA